MKALKKVWRALLLILLIGAVAGVLNVVLHNYVMESWVQAQKEDEVAVSTYAINLFVGWVFFSAWLLTRSEDEFKSVEEAIYRGDKDAFLIEARKEISPSIRVLYVIISILVVLSFHLFDIANAVTNDEIQFGTAFLVVITVIFLFDLDTPIGGAITVSGVPKDWLQAMHTLHKKDDNTDVITERAETQRAKPSARD
jgi:hypothetical protein